MIIYIVGNSYESSGVYSFGLKLASALVDEVLLVLLDSRLGSSSQPSALNFPINESHRPKAVARQIQNFRTAWPARVSILPNNSSCGYELARVLRETFEEVGVVSSIVGIVHSNVGTSICLVRDNLFMVDKVFAVSDAILSSLDADIDNGVKWEALPYAMQDFRASLPRRRLPDIHRCLKLIYVGRLVEDQKRVSRLTQLVVALRTRMVPFILQVVGDGHLADDLARVAASHPSGEADVLMSGELSQTQVLEAMSTSDLLVLTSEFEGSPLVVMEAMSVGAVPVVMNYGPEVNELITHGRNGYVVEQGRVDEMADMLGLLASDRKKLKELSDNALLRASEFMSFNTWIDEICRPTPPRLIGNDYRNSSYVETWERIKRGVRKIHADDKVLIWGGGHIGRLIVDELILNNHQLDGCVVVDRVLHKYLPRYRDVAYYSSEKLPEKNFDVAIVASEYYAAEIQAALEDLKRKHNPTLHITAVRDWR